jgi:hypothetical protein
MRSSLGYSLLALGVTTVGCGASSIPKTGVTSEGAAELDSSADFVSITVPDSGWHLTIERICERNDEVWILARLRRDPEPASQIVRPVRERIPVTLPAKPRRVFVVGKTWKWTSPSDKSVEFVDSLESVMKNLGKARVLFPPSTS